MRILNIPSFTNKKDFLESLALREAYRRTRFYDCQYFFELLWMWQTKQITKENFEKEIEKSKLKFELKNTDKISVSGKFNPENGFTTIVVSTGLLDLLKLIESKFDAVAYSQIEKIAKYFWNSFVHEDTHKQQADVTPLKVFDKYVRYELNSDPFDLDILNNLKYFSQPHEADAFGREAAELAKYEYLENNKKAGLEFFDVSEIFKSLRNNAFKEKQLLDIVKTYRDPRIPENIRRKFIRAFYDYLSGEEL